MTYHYVTLTTPQGAIIAWEAYSEAEAQQLAEKIQSFLMSAESQISVVSDSFDLGDLLVSITYSLVTLAVFTGIIVAGLTRRRLTFDRFLDQILEEYLTPFGIRGEKTYSFRDVQQVVVRKSTSSEGSTFFSVEVELHSGETLLRLSFGSDGSKAMVEAEQLGHLLGCPVKLPEATP